MAQVAMQQPHPADKGKLLKVDTPQTSLHADIADIVNALIESHIPGANFDNMEMVNRESKHCYCRVMYSKGSQMYYLYDPNGKEVSQSRDFIKIANTIGRIWW